MAFDIRGARDAGYSDDEIAQYLAQEQQFDFTAAREAGYEPAEIIEHLSQKSGGSAVRRLVADPAISLAKGVVGAGESIVGLNEMARAGLISKAADALGIDQPKPESAGYRPKETKAAMDTLLTPEQRAADLAVDKAEGVGGTLSAVASNPSVIPHKVIESVPSMMGGAAVARGLTGPALVRGAMGEGIVSAGSTAEQIRQESGGKLSDGQAGIALGSGGLTGLFGAAGGKLAQKLGIADIDTWLAGGATAEIRKGMAKRVIGGAISEGLLEEMPQSAQEQIAQNVATGKPWDEGVGKSATLGAIVGGVMGGGTGVVTSPTAPAAPATTSDPVSDILPIATANTVDEAIAAAEAALDTPLPAMPEAAPALAAEPPVAPRPVDGPGLTELTQAARLTRSEDRRAEISAELERRAALVAGEAQPTPQEPANAPLEAPGAPAAVQPSAVPTLATELAAAPQEAAPEAAVQDAPVFMEREQAPIPEQPAPVAAPVAESAPTVAQTATPQFDDYEVGGGEVRTFKTEKSALAFKKQQGKRVPKVYAPRQLEDGRWALSRPAKVVTPEQVAAQAAKSAKTFKDRTSVRTGDDALTIVKKRGGWNASDAMKDGVDPATVKEYRFAGGVGTPVFRKNGGRSIDGIAEVLAEEGFDVLDEAGRPDAFKAREIMADALAGNKVYSPEGATLAAEAEANRQYEPDEAELSEAELVKEDAGNAAIVHRAIEIDDGAVEALAIQYGDDEAGFIRAVQELVNDQSDETVAGRQARAQASASETAEAPDLETALAQVAAVAAEIRATGPKEMGPALEKLDRARAAADRAGANARQVIQAMEAERRPMGPEKLVQALERPTQSGQERTQNEQVTEPRESGVSASEPLALTSETESEIRTRETQQKKSDEAKAKRDAAPDASGFTLTGSDRQVDEAEARGQKPMFARKPKAPLPYDKQIDTPAFRRWFGKSKVVDEDGKPLVVYHGTPNDFTVFDPARGNIESDFGAGIYFTNTQEDVAANYADATKGPDLTQKIELRAEQIFQELETDVDEPAAWGTDAYKARMEEARQLARDEFAQHDGMTMPVYLAIKKPFVIGGNNETQLDFQFQYADPRDTDSEIIGTKGTLADFLSALENVASRFDDVGELTELRSEIEERSSYDSMSASELMAVLKGEDGTRTSSEALAYATDENGKLASHEIIRQALEAAGFDGIIDHAVDVKFGSQRRMGRSMQGMNEGTVHYIAFRPEQVKSAIGNSGKFDKNNPDILFGRDTAQAASLSVDAIRSIIEPIVAKWANAPDVTVIASMDEAPKAVRQMDARQLAQGAEGRPFAFFHGVQVYIIASEIRSEQQAIEGLYHEALGHYGLRGVFGDKLDSVLSSLVSARSADVTAKAKAYGLDILKREDKLLAAEEVLAELAQKRPAIGFVRKAIVAIRSALRSLGVEIEYSDDDIIAKFILPAREFVERGNSKSAMSGTTFHRAYHGTPYDFDKFDISKIGTGEGAQAYGHGLYFAGKKEVAEFYKNNLSQKPVPMPKATVDLLRADDFLGFDTVAEARGAILSHSGDWAERWEASPATVAAVNEWIGASQKNRGRLYEVELAPKEEEYLDWDKFYNQQSPKVQKALESVGILPEDYADTAETGRTIYRDVGVRARSVADAKSEANIQPLASAALAEAGIPGIKYLDGSSRGRGEGAYNYVIFDDKHVEVKAKFARAPAWADSDALKSAASKVDTYAPDKPIKVKVSELTARWKERLVQGMFDAYAPLKRLGPTEYVKARMVKAADGAMEGMLLYGKPKMGDDGAIYGEIDQKGFLGAMKELQGEHDRFFMWVAGNRAERLMAQDKEHLFTADEIKAMKGLIVGKMKDGTSRPQAYAKAATTLREYNKSVLDIAEKTGLIQGESRHLWEHDFYIPFFRVGDDMKIDGPSTKVKGLVRQQAFKKLTGGQENLGDLLDNTLRNWSHLLSASMANQAAVASLKAAERIGVAREVAADTKGSTYAMVAGQKTHYEVDDPLILTAISAMESASFKGLPMQIMGKFKHYLTLGVTVSPTFRVRNLLRDSISAIGQNDMNYNVLSNLAKGYKGTNRKSAEYGQMLFNGALMRFGQLTDGKHAEHAKRLIDSGVDDQTILTNPEKVKNALGKVWDEWQEFGDRMENINRTALYKKLKAEGKTDMEAAFAARDMLDFSLQGSWVAVRFLTQIVPFMNARLQGMYKLGRATMQDPARMAYVSGAVALASIALMLFYEDDEDWKAREDWDRDTFWWFKIGGVAYRIPKPFEIGAIGTLAERSIEFMFNDEMTPKRFKERLKYMLGETFALNPTPQFFKPMLDLYANKDSFTGRQIESRGMQNMTKSERATPYTSLVAKLIGKTEAVSPVQADHLIRSYFGWLGSHVTMSVDLMAQPFMGAEKPTRKLGDYLVVGDFVKDLPASQSRYVEQFYKQAQEVHEVMGNLKAAREAGDVERVRDILAEKKADVALSRLYSSAEHRMGEINSRIRRVHASSKSGEEKRAELDRLTNIRNELAKTVDARARERREAAAR